jgi:hypothetical protein
MRTHSRSKIWRGAVLVALSLAAGFSLSSMATTKDPPWIAKDWTDWTGDDCSKVMQQSPWAHSSGYSGTYASLGSLVQLRSALPIREAVLRQTRLDSHYDKMKADKKQAFDNAHSHDLDPGDQVLVYIANTSFDPPPTQFGQADIVEGPTPATQAALQLSNGAFIPPIQTNQVKYDAGGPWRAINQFEYVFPRAVNGKPLYSPSNSNLQVVLGAPLSIDKKTKLVIQEPFRYAGPVAVFKISDLMYKGKLEY